MDVFEAIRGRRSIRNYEDKPVEPEKIGMLLEACRWAPSAGNRQPWEVIVVDDPEIIERLARASLDQMWMTTAPVILAMCMNMNILKGTYGERSEMYALESMGMAIQNIMLTAYSLGLGTCCVAAFEEDEVMEILNCLKIIKPVALITVGYPAEEPPAPERDDITSFSYYNSYGKHYEPKRPSIGRIKKKVKNKLIKTLERF
ncbi:MAG TPA: nitroreductase family protein [Candidatus Aenigmarchaeota archaeon]|nr:nitroreductase family protein [Candidatus Aenigmarchaeota archaeon]